MKLSIIIKTHNEQDNIRRALESCFIIISKHSGEVIVADCRSTDDTTQIALEYPAKVVCLDKNTPRSCGVAPQLGFQYSSGEYIFLVDGDMEINADFVDIAIGQLEKNPKCAGVGGRVQDINMHNLEFQMRNARFEPHLEPGIVDRLDGGGIYRREAIAQVGYLSDRNLHGFEEFDLGSRLRKAGWHLRRVACVSVLHYGYTIGHYQLLWRRICSGNVFASGELLRAAFINGLVADTLSRIGLFRTTLFVIIWSIVFISTWFLNLPVFEHILTCISILVAPILIMSLRRRSIAGGLYSVTVWVVYTIGLFIGISKRRSPPQDWIGSKVLSRPIDEV